MSLDHLEALMSHVNLNHVPETQAESLREGVAAIYASAAQRVEGMRSIRQLLASEDPPIDAVLNSGVAPIVIHFLHPDAEENSPELLFEASWAMLNLMSGDDIQIVRCIQSTDAITALVALVADARIDVRTREHGVWAIGNIAGTGHRFRLTLLEHGCLPHMVQFLADCTAVNFNASNGLWAIGNLYRQFDGERPDPLPFIAVLPQILHYSTTSPETVKAALFLVKELTTPECVRVMGEHGQLYAARNFALWCLGCPWDTSDVMEMRSGVLRIIWRMTSVCVQKDKVTGMVRCVDSVLLGRIAQGGIDRAALWVLKEHLRHDSDPGEVQLCRLAALILSDMSYSEALVPQMEESRTSLTILQSISLLPVVSANGGEENDVLASSGYDLDANVLDDASSEIGNDGHSADDGDDACFEGIQREKGLLRTLQLVACALWGTFFAIAACLRRKNELAVLADHHRALTQLFPQHQNNEFPGSLLCPELEGLWRVYVGYF